MGMTDIRIENAVLFEELRSADLVLDCIYRGGTENGTGGEPINRLLPVGNSGGIRRKGSLDAPLLIALCSTGNEEEWPDSFDPSTSILTYYGDNRKPGAALLDTPKHGNETLRHTFARAHGDPQARAQVAPLLLFASTGQRRDNVFCGLLAPGAQHLTADEDLVVVSHDRNGLNLRNYQAKFTVLDAERVTRAWLNDVLAGEPLSDNCPGAWREWVTHKAYRPLALGRGWEPVKPGSLPLSTLRFPQDADELTTRAEFDAQSADDPPISDEDARKRIQREIVARQGQSGFRESLIQAYRGQCAVTECTVLPVLEAAHLQPYRGKHTNRVTNGLLLRADIHTLLDSKLLALERETREIVISKLLVSTQYNQLSGKRVAEPITAKQRPADSVLEKVWLEFCKAEEKR